jgi:MFS family permease
MISVGTWFHRNRALAFGVVSSGSSLGGIVYPIMMNGLTQRIGFGWAVRSILFLMLAMLIVANLTVKSRLKLIPTPVRLSEFTAPFREPAFSLVCLGSCNSCGAGGQQEGLQYNGGAAIRG